MAEHITTQFEIVGDAQYKKALVQLETSLLKLQERKLKLQLELVALWLQA